MNDTGLTSLGHLLRVKLDKPVALTSSEYTMHRVFVVNSEEYSSPRYIMDVKRLAMELADKDSEVETVFVRQSTAKDHSKIYVVQAWNNNTTRYQQDYFFDFKDAAGMIDLYSKSSERFGDITINTATLS